MKKKTGIVLFCIGAAGVVATAWLGAYLDVRWVNACAVQGMAFAAVAIIGGAFAISLED